MSEKKANCLVLGHADGPPCGDCFKPMDSIKVQSNEKGMRGKDAHYCYHCTYKG